MTSLTPRQWALAEAWLPGMRIVADHAWGLLEGAVLEVVAGGCRYVVKTGGPSNSHLPREIAAHTGGATSPLVALGATSRLVRADLDAKLLVLEWVEGVLTDGTPAASDPEVHRQAGVLLRVLHDSRSVVDAGWEAERIAKTLASLDTPHRIPAERVDAVRRILGSVRPASARLVPTHGDWQPRNWLLDGDRVRVIDWGRFDLRPAATDLEFLDSRAWRDRPDLEAAFLEGYGGDPRDPEVWRLERLQQAVGTAIWAHHVGDERFEQEGHELLTRALGVQGNPRSVGA